jgi:VanZ family protein
MVVDRFASQVRRALAAPRVRRAVRVLWAVSVGLVIVLSVIPDAAPAGPAGIDKLWHALAYMALGFGGAFGRTGPGRYKAVAAMIALGWATECGQALLPWRSAEWADGLVNTLAALIGGALAQAISRWAAAPSTHGTWSRRIRR